MRRVTGIGGVFFRAKDAPALRAWYRRHLGIDMDMTYGYAAFPWTGEDGEPVAGTSILSITNNDSDQFMPGTASFMINFRVENVRALVASLREEGCQVLDRVDESEYGVFAWVIDPEGHKIELWQPPVGQ